MKKHNLLKVVASLFAILALSSLIISCNKTVADENGCYTDGESAMAAAKKADNNILIIATMDGDDLFSSDLINNVIKNANFKEEICKQYTVLAMDFSEASYSATAINEQSTEEEIKIADEKAEKMQQNTLLASRLNLELTPAIYIMSKDMCFITKLDFLTEQITDYNAFKNMLESQSDIVEEFNEKMKKIESGSTLEKLAAIDEIYETTDTYYRTFLLDLIKEYIKLDKKNESGLLSKYLLAKADIESSNYFMAGDIVNAVKIYSDTAEDIRLSPEHRQNAYYLAAYILVWGNSTDFDTIRGYLQKSIDAYPEGPNSQFIQQVMDQINQVISNAGIAIPDETEQQVEQ